MTVFLDPPNDIQRITELLMVISVDETGEGVVSAPLPGSDAISVPLIAADRARFDSFVLPMAKAIAKMTKKKLKVIRMTVREEVQDVDP